MKTFIILMFYFFSGVIVVSGAFGVWATGELGAFLKIPLAGIIFGLPWYLGGVLGLAAYSYKRGPQ